jgi:serine/threonine protein kinase
MSSNQKVDVYSFGLLLLDMATQEPLLDFLGERWRLHIKKNRAPTHAISINRPITEECRRPDTSKSPVPSAPLSINDLIVECCMHEPSDRPSFAEVRERKRESSYLQRMRSDTTMSSKRIFLPLAIPHQPPP